MLAVLVILGGSLSAFAIEPVRVQVWGAVMNSGEFEVYPCTITSVGNNTFVCSLYGASDVLSPCTYIYLYFAFDVTSISSFDLKLSIDSSRYNNNSLTDRGNLTDNTIGLWEYNNGSFVNNINIRSQVTGSTTLVDGIHYYEWFWSSSTSYNKNCLRVTLPYNTFVAGNGFKVEFSIDSFVINGVETVFTAGEQSIINNLVSINGTLQDDSTYYQSSSEIPSPDTSHIGDGGSFASSALNEKLGLFDISGAVQRTLVPLGKYLFTPNSFNDSSAGHTAIVAISTVSMCVVVIVWIINSLHRSRGWVE